MARPLFKNVLNLVPNVLFLIRIEISSWLRRLQTVYSTVCFLFHQNIARPMLYSCSVLLIRIRIDLFPGSRTVSVLGMRIRIKEQENQRRYVL
jgi:hypothetical protein